MRLSLHIRAIAALVLISAGIAWSTPDACAQRRNRKTAEQPQSPQKQKITITLSLSELRDSINRYCEKMDEETNIELFTLEQQAYLKSMRRVDSLTRFKPIYNESSGSYLGDLVVDIAKEHLGKPYVWGAEGPNEFDCSGFMMFCYRHVGVKLPRTSREQFKLGEEVEIPDLKKGDLVFWSGFRGTVGESIGHVGMICDVDYEKGYFYFIHANSSHKGVSISRSDERYFLLHYKGARRIIPLDR